MRHASFRVFSSLAVIGVIAIAGLLAFSSGLNWLIAYLIAINLLTFIYYAYDKAAAGSRFWRIPETILHLLVFGGAAPAALAGQKLLRHKTLKASFQRTFRLIVVAQILIILGLLYYFFGR
jgi:uncharacterized membrane protein YsdA (DUF1294 family)